MVGGRAAGWTAVVTRDWARPGNFFEPHVPVGPIVYLSRQSGARGEGLSFGNSRRRFLLELLKGASYGLLSLGVKSMLDHGEQSAIFVQQMVAQPQNVFPAVLHDLLWVPAPLKQEIQAQMKLFLRLLPGVVFQPHAVKGEINAFQMVLNCRVQDLFFLDNMSVKGVGYLPAQPGQPVRGFAAVSRQAQNAELLVKFIQ
jgi:hypothetical protein